MKKNLVFLFLGLFMGLFLGIAVWLTSSAISFQRRYEKEQITKREREYSTEISKVIDIVDRHFLGEKEVDKQALYNYAVQGIISRLDDRYSEFLSAEELKRMTDDLNGTYVGLGFEASNGEGKYLDILTVFLDSPAFKAGLLANDLILEIDGKDTKPMTSDESFRLIRGEKGAKVNLKIKRQDKVFNVIATRDEIKSKVVDFKMLNDGIAYIYLSQFPKKISKEVILTIENLKKQGMKKLIFDLRGNTGGEILEVEDIASCLLPEDKKFLFSVEHKTFKTDEYKKTVKQIFNGEMLVLVNSRTASASEILTAILKDYNRAKVIGEKTFGKGIIQNFFYLDSGDIIKLTAGRYLTPSKNEIHKVGIEPDIKISMNELLAKTAYINETDEQHLKRMEIIKPILIKEYGEKEANRLISKGDVQLKEAIKILSRKK